MHLLGVVLFLAGLWVLYRELSDQHFQDILLHFSSFPKLQLFLAIFCTALNYYVLTGYEWLGLKYVRRPLKYRSILPASFIANALGHNVGAAALSGTAIRYRMYSTWGLSLVDTAQVIMFCGVTATVGLITVLGMTFLSASPKILAYLPFSIHADHVLGVIFLLFVFLYISFCIFAKKPLKIREKEFRFPSAAMAAGQMIFSLMDCLLAASALYILLPTQHGISFPVFLSLFVVAQIFGMMSQIPGGVGVFEATFMAALSKTLPADKLFVSLLYYRLVYYALPLLISLIILAISQFRRPAVKN